MPETERDPLVNTIPNLQLVDTLGPSNICCNEGREELVNRLIVLFMKRFFPASPDGQENALDTESRAELISTFAYFMTCNNVAHSEQVLVTVPMSLAGHGGFKILDLGFPNKQVVCPFCGISGSEENSSSTDNETRSE